MPETLTSNGEGQCQKWGNLLQRLDGCLHSFGWRRLNEAKVAGVQGAPCTSAKQSHLSTGEAWKAISFKSELKQNKKPFLLWLMGARGLKP